MNPRIGEQAANGGNAKAAKTQTEQRALLESVLPEALPLETEEDAQRLLALSADLTFRGFLSGSQAGAISKTVDIWLRAGAQKLDRGALVEAQAQIAKLKAELRSLRQGRGHAAMSEA